MNDLFDTWMGCWLLVVSTSRRRRTGPGGRKGNAVRAVRSKHTSVSHLNTFPNPAVGFVDHMCTAHVVSAADQTTSAKNVPKQAG